MTPYEHLYQKAIEADNAYEEAIRKQFGTCQNRFDNAKKDYNPATSKAYLKKIRLDKALLNFSKRRFRK